MTSCSIARVPATPIEPGRPRLWTFLGWLTIGLLAVAGSSATGTRSTQGASVDTNDERSALLKTDMEFSRTSAVKGVTEAFQAYLADDAVLFPANADLVSGRESIRLHLAANEGAILGWKPLRAEVSRAGDLGYTYGTYERRGSFEDGTPRVTYGKYVSVWRKQVDGDWKLVAQIGNASPAPPSPSPGTTPSPNP